MVKSCRILIALLLASFLMEVPLRADKRKKPVSDDEGMTLEVSTKKKKKKGDDEMTQTLPLPKEAPTAVVAETDRLFFQVSPLTGKGLLSQQTREAMRALLRTSHGTSIVKLRAFVAGSGDTRRIQEIAGEVFGEKKLPLPALSVIQAGALPLEGAQVVIEGIGVEKKVVNPNGVAFISGQSAASLDQSLDKFKTVLRAAGMDAQDTLRVTCFVSSLDENKDGRGKLEAAFPGIALDLVQMQRGPVNPGAECEGVARLRTMPAKPVFFVEGTPNYSQMVEVGPAKVVLSSTQLGFGAQEADIKLAFERLQKGLAGFNAKLDNLVFSHFYLTSMSFVDTLRGVRKGFYSSQNPPASTLLPFEGLPSLDASFGVDVIAVAESPGL